LTNTNGKKYIAMKHFFFIILVFSSGFLFSRSKTPKDYEYLRTKYERYSENDTRAFLYLNQYIKKAKSEGKTFELFQGYRDAVFYSKSSDQKLRYADSCIDAAYKSTYEDRIATAYVLKGSIFYAKLKKYKPALDEYLMAYKYSKNSDDLYLKHKVSYHLGVVKNYLGYNEEALELFKECLTYFEAGSNNPNLHQNEIFNNKKGYLNTLHQTVVCYRYLNDFKKLDSLTEIGLLKTFNNADFMQERAYFLKSKGISEYNNTKYQSSIDYLEESLSLMKDDFAWKSVDYFYIGKSYLALKNEDDAIANFKKIDSIFNDHSFILPELRENYEFLINHYKAKKDSEKQLYYTTQLLKADSILAKDFSYLAMKIHRDYDTNALIEEKGKLEKANNWGIILISVLAVTAGSLLLIILKRKKKEKRKLDSYLLLEEKLRNNSYTHPDPPLVAQSIISDDKKACVTDAVTKDLLQKLQRFEEKKQFTQKGLTIQKLAIQLETNTNYLSHVINEQKGMNFNKYLGDLRIRHITCLLFDKNIYLNYTIETLAKECGIASRQNFSDLFFEINGIRPTDFIRKRKKEIENGKYPDQDVKKIPGLISDN
jgi:AraC-like DNA-binding protein